MRPPTSTGQTLLVAPGAPARAGGGAASHHHHRFPLPPDQLALLLHLYVQLTRLHRIADRHHELI
jgi:hypothetical protein